MNQDNSKSTFWDKTFEDKPSSQIQPVPTVHSTKVFEDTVTNQDRILKDLDPFLYRQYKKGTMLSDGDVEYYAVLETTIVCIFQCIRNSVNDEIENMDERQEMLLKVSAAQSVFESGTQVLKSLNLKLDINSVLSIIHGYISKSFCYNVTNYEHVKSTKN